MSTPVSDVAAFVIPAPVSTIPTRPVFVPTTQGSASNVAATIVDDVPIVRLTINSSYYTLSQNAAQVNTSDF